MKDNKIFGVMQRVGRSFMLPIAILPVAGLFLGVGGSLTNQTMLETYGLMSFMGPGSVIYAILNVVTAAGEIVFANLPMIFAIGVAIGMARAEKATAALAGAIAFFVMNAAIGAMIAVQGGADAMIEGSVTSVVGIQSLQMGVFGGIIVGLGVAALHNRFYKIQLKPVLSFFAGTRFVPIISASVYLIVGILMFFVWPPVQSAINSVGSLVRGSGYLGTWIYGIMERALIPFGLHHVFYLPFWQTAVGGSMEVGGRVVEGAQNIFFAQLADPNTKVFAVEATRFMSGKFPFMIFGLPGAALAMYRLALPEKRKVVGGLLISAALTSMLTGITEPIEFTFLFVAPLLYGVHCILAGASYMLMHILQVAVGMTFSGGLIDLFLFGVMQGNAKTHWIWIVVVGLAYFAIYYFLFSYIIRKKDLKTPGRDDNEEVKLYTRADVNARDNVSPDGVLAAPAPLSAVDRRSLMITHGLGGKSNIKDVDNCITRLRCTVVDATKVNEALLKESGAAGVVRAGTGVQVIYGPTVSVIKSELEEYLERAGAEAECSEDVVPTAPQNAAAPLAEAKAPEEKPFDPADYGHVVELKAPLNGRAIPLSEVPDEAFASGMVGRGAAILPTEGKLFAPCDGTVAMVFPTLHALGLVMDEGLELILHIGVDTVKLNGEGFKCLVEVGQSVKQGEALIEFDLAVLDAHGLSSATPIIATNLKAEDAVVLQTEAEILTGEAFLKIYRK